MTGVQTGYGRVYVDELGRLEENQFTSGSKDDIIKNIEVTAEVKNIRGFGECDTAEVIAEAFVKARNGEKLPSEAISLPNNIIKKWRK